MYQIESRKLHSKSYKQIYMDWMYEKYLRNQELRIVETICMEEMAHTAPGSRRLPPLYPVRIIELLVDLDKTARELISLLQKASQFQEQWCQPGVINDIEQFLKHETFLDTCRLYEEEYGEQYCSQSLNNNSEIHAPKNQHPVFDSLKCIIPVYSYWDQTHFQFVSNSLVNNQTN
ncbi:unnamed protein product [Rotaria magnacalcarata]|uniref:Uncharacterized protein n=1 Tax=Rotaria magnacalcarata TaxID=392030 RepID=A0A8S2K0G8_9BILA|nr:unnamed protein product [Rotaria magnacalcarata]CAF3914993.1 unnamed protein product [Rotaria magnacalcarata]CAF5002840.1 unnamed protein product [Rotaria magnacalcarata]